MARERVLSVTASDCRFEVYPGHPVETLKEYQERLGFEYIKVTQYTVIKDKDKEGEYQQPIDPLYSVMTKDDMHEGWVAALMCNLPSNHEAAVDGLVMKAYKQEGTYQHREFRYLKMLDFKTGDLDVAWETAKSLGDNPSLFFSGQSFHAYWPELLHQNN